MLYHIFKIIRKLDTSWHKTYIKIKIFYYYHISKRKLILKSPLVIGKAFSIHTDITETSVSIKANCRIRDNFKVTIGNNGSLLVEEHCFFNNNCSINCLGNIEIGNHNQFGENVLIYDHNHNYSDSSKLISEQGYNIGTIKIGNNCWIGSQVVILKDVEIGDNVVIGAGCIIYKSIPAGSIVINKQNLLISTPNK